MSMSIVQSLPVAEGLFEWPSASPKLLGSSCADCGTITFPVTAGCPGCSSESLATIPLSTSGEIWTWTSQEFRPKSPPYVGADGDAFERFHVGYIELPEGLRVEARLTGFDDRDPAIGDRVELTVIPFGVNDDGDTLVTYAFSPTASTSHKNGSDS
jgi:uncharacterized OB-fold protein